MYALFMAGMYLERMLGKTRFITAYLITGVIASLASLWWHKDPVPSAGASGAIFGMYGVFLALLSTNLIPKQIRNSLLQSIAVFVVYNLVYGMKSGVDNAAHIGGLISGVIIGYVYFPGLKKEDKKPLPVVGVVLALGIAAAVFYLQSNVATQEVRNKTKMEVSNATYKDADRFNELYNEIIGMQEKALAPIREETLSDEERATRLREISLPEWEKAAVVAKRLKELRVSETTKKKGELMEQYINLRKEQVAVMVKYLGHPDEASTVELNELTAKINGIIEELDKL
jgi:rhomboid protease GluP